jgi:serine/threonine protein kinase
MPAMDWLKQLISVVLYIRQLGWVHCRLHPEHIHVASDANLRVGGLQFTHRAKYSRKYATDVASIGWIGYLLLNRRRTSSDSSLSYCEDDIELRNVIQHCWHGAYSSRLLHVLQQLATRLDIPRQSKSICDAIPTADTISPAPKAVALSTSLQSQFAVVKIARPENSDSAESVADEIQFSKRMRHNHPNLVRYLAATDCQLYMECYLAGSLDIFLDDSGPDYERPIREWTKQLLSALEYIHDLGWAHNDLKLSQVLVADEGRTLKLGDFGSARYRQTEPVFINSWAPELYNEWQMVDCPCSKGGSYCQSLLPEYRTVLPSSVDRGMLGDVYALGRVLWHMHPAPMGGGGVLTGWVLEEESLIVGCRSYLEEIDPTGSEVEQIIRSCGSHWTVRPTFKELQPMLVDVGYYA